MEAKILRIVEETPLVRRIFFDVSLNFKPGQWVSISSNNFMKDEKLIRRAYSVASNPHEPLQLIVAEGENFSKFLCNSNVGDIFEIQGPFGKFELKNNNAFFIAAGTGLSPFIPMINQALKENKRVKLLYSVRTEKDIICKEWLKSVNTRIVVVITLTREKNPSYEFGRIPIILEKYLESDFDYYLCGYSDFIKDVSDVLLRNGIEQNRILFDKWG